MIFRAVAANMPGSAIGGLQPRSAAQPRSLAGATRSAWWERLLVGSLALIFPLEANLPTVFGISSGRLIFGFLALWALAARRKELIRVISEPVFRCGALFFFVVTFIELFHPQWSLVYLFRVGQMFAAAALVAAICRDAKMLRAGLLGCIVSGSVLSVVMFLSAHGKLALAQAEDFEAASAVRAEVFSNALLQENLNRLSFVAAQGAVVALAFALGGASRRYRWWFLVLGSVCLIGTFLPLSRGGVIAAVMSSGVVLLRSRQAFWKKCVTVTAASLVAALLVPGVAFKRMTIATSENREKEDSRIRLYRAAAESVGEYALLGVGAGNYWHSWGRSHGFAKHGATLGAHNAFLQTTICWGAAALLALLLVVYEAYRCLPRGLAPETLTTALYGMAMCSVLFLLMSHILYSKQLALALGLIVAGKLLPRPRRSPPGRWVPDLLRRRQALLRSNELQLNRPPYGRIHVLRGTARQSPNRRRLRLPFRV